MALVTKIHVYQRKASYYLLTKKATVKMVSNKTEKRNDSTRTVCTLTMITGGVNRNQFCKVKLVVFVQLHSSLFQTEELCYMHRQLLLDSHGRVIKKL